MKKFIFPFLIFFALGSVSCGVRVHQSEHPPSNAESGAVSGALIGAILGQAIGNDTEATVIGAVVGGMYGYAIGNEMDKEDLARLNGVYEKGSSEKTIAWKNPDTGNSYKVTPKPAYRHKQNKKICRKAEIVARIGGELKKTYTTACRNNQGEWILLQ